MDVAQARKLLWAVGRCIEYTAPSSPFCQPDYRVLHVAVWSAFDSHSMLDVQCTALGALIQLAMSTDLRTGLEVP